MRNSCSKLLALIVFLAVSTTARGAVLFEDHFSSGIPGWSVSYPPGVYMSGPLQWEYDIVAGAFVERSNIHTDDAGFSPSAVAPMLINDTVTGASFTYTARLNAGDDDGFGLIFGYQNPTNFYRLTFARQIRTAGYPWGGWVVDRKVNGVTTNLFGFGKPGYIGFTNTANRPFDVTITVSAANLLTLSIVDNPTGTPVVYSLVTAQPLPGPANGRVGIFTWGMDGGTPDSFRIQNLNLSPLALTGNPNALTNWTPVVPPRENGSAALTGGAAQANWFLKVGTDGPLGTLEEAGDTLIGNDAAGQVDFSAPTLVAGSDTWTNYVMAARLLPGDDDGQGILLRYKNATNFYRIAMRSQVSGSGIPAGLSVQKNVNRDYTEVYRDSPVKYNPVAGVPYDLIAQISNSTLSVWLVADPDDTATLYEYGPFAITGVDNGKVGLFSWGMARSEFDWVSVQDGAPLYVSSAYGSPSPGRGLNTFTPGMVLTAYSGAATNSAGIRRSPAGWIGSGSAPASGTGTNVTFRIGTFSRLHWQWLTEYQLTVTNTGGGTVIGPGAEWFASGSNVTLVAVTNAGFVFTAWTGDAASTSPTLQLTMNQPYSVTANFVPDTDNDGLPDDWELAYFQNLNATAEGDNDGDGKSNLQEFRDGTNPTVADILKIAELRLPNSNASILTISNNTGTRFSVQRSVTLSSNWATISTEPLGGTNVYGNSFTSAVPAGSSAFWRLAQPARQTNVPPFVAGSWTLAVLPDTQIYSQDYPELFKDQTRWIVANKERRNIKYVLHLGDIVNVQTAGQWANAKAAISILDGKIPYALAPGNHDTFGDRTSMINTYFPVSNYVSWPTFGGAMVANQAENTYHLFEAGGVNWLVLSLEYGPRNGVAAWANQIATNYPHHRKILITHAYMYFDDTRYDWVTRGASQSWSPYSSGLASFPGGVNDGEDLWQKVVKVNTNFVMVFNGHVLNDGLGRLSNTNDFGQVVHQMLVNYQMKTLGGEAYLRLVEFHPDGKTVQVKAYSPYYGTYKTDPDNQFQLTLQPPLN